MITGIFLVLFSWAAILAFVYALGFPFAYLLNGKVNGSRTFRASLWTGILIATILILAIGIFLPLRSGAAAIIFMSTVFVGVIFTTVFHVKGKKPFNFRAQWNWPKGLLIGALGLSVVYLAAAALGPVTNYDSGLYHLGAIKYAGDFATIPGLANLYFPFGYNTSLYPVGAFMGNGPWGGIGYRLFNGFIISVLIIDLLSRLLTARKDLRTLSVGGYFLLFSVPVSLVPLISLSDYWVTSPSSDASVLVITLVSVGYLLDAITLRKNVVANASISFIAAVIAFSFRPTMVVFLVTLSLILLYRIYRNNCKKKQLLLVPSILGIMLFAVQSARDYILSGWLQYPLSIFPFNVSWQAADPVDNRAATLGNARNPFDIWGSVTGFDWLSPYFSRLPSQWETYFVSALAVLALLLLLLVRLSGLHMPWRAVVITESPVLAAVTTWFLFSPPTFRFGWGPVFSLFLIPIAFAFKELNKGGKLLTPASKLITAQKIVLLPGLSLMLLVVIGFNTSVRFQHEAIVQSSSWTIGSISVPFLVAPIIDVPVKPIELASGLTVITPTQSDQCWDNFPLCTPSPIASLTFRDSTIQGGFLP